MNKKYGGYMSVDRVEALRENSEDIKRLINPRHKVAAQIAAFDNGLKLQLKKNKTAAEADYCPDTESIHVWLAFPTHPDPDKQTFDFAFGVDETKQLLSVLRRALTRMNKAAKK